MRARLLFVIASLSCRATGMAAQEPAEVAPRSLAAAIVVIDSSPTGIVRREQLQAMAVAAADSMHLRLVPFDLASSSSLPDTLLVVVVRVWEGGRAYDVSPKWLVTKASFRPRKRFSPAQLGITCGSGVASGATHDPGAARMRAWLEAQVAKALHDTFACYRRETSPVAGGPP